MSRGVSLPEILVACFLVGLLITAAVAIFNSGTAASFKSSARNDLMYQLKLSVRLLRNSLQQTSIESVSAGTGVLACLTHYDAQGRPAISSEGRPFWQAYELFYHQSSDSKLYLQRVELVVPAIQNDFPTPIEEYDAGSGPRPLAHYSAGGRPVAGLVENFEVVIDPLFRSFVDVTLNFLKPREGNRPESRAPFQLRIYPKN